MLATSISEAVASLYAAKQRTFLALLGIVIGVGSVIAMVSVGMIMAEESLRSYNEIGIDLVGIVKREDGEIQTPRLNLASAMKLAETTTTLRASTPVVKDWQYIRTDDARGYAQVLGITESFTEVHRLKLKAGRFLTKLDRKHNFVVLGPEIYWYDGQPDFAPSLIGKHVRLGDETFTVVGLLEPSADTYGVMDYSANYAALVYIDHAMRLAESADINIVAGRLKHERLYPQAVVEIERHFQRYARGVPVEVRSAADLIKTQQKQAFLFTLLLGAIGSISLVVGGVGVMNVMLVSVSERRREIGIRRALGASRLDIQSQFLIEAVLLSLIGGLFGIGLGVGGSYLYTYFQGLEFIIAAGAIWLGFGVSSTVGVFFGLYPAWQASRLDPIAALRSE